MSIQPTVFTKLACATFILLFVKVFVLIGVVLAITVVISKRNCIINEKEMHRSLKATNIPRSTRFPTPWMLSLVDLSNDNKEIVCGAVIISVKWALTTAYCVASVSNKTNAAFYGGSNYLNKGGIYHLFTNVITYKKYNSMDLNNTITIVEVLPYFDNLREIPIQIDEPVHKTKLNIFGWQSDSYYKNLIKIVITDFTFCNLTDGKYESMCVKFRSKAYSFIQILPGAVLVKDNFVIGLSYDVLIFQSSTAHGMFLNVTYWNTWIQKEICARLK